MIALLALAAFVFHGGVQAQNRGSAHPSSLTLVDRERDRSIPVTLYFPTDASICTATYPCPAAFIGAGHGIGYQRYSFIASAVHKKGYLVVCIEHELASDAPAWRRGADSIRFVRTTLSASYLGFDWQRLVLFGHSMGGDVSTWLLRDSAPFISAIVTLDHRRVALPRTSAIRVLSIRASDFEADARVLPSREEQAQFGACIVRLEGARHNDMFDGGSAELKGRIAQIITSFLRPPLDGKQAACPQ